MITEDPDEDRSPFPSTPTLTVEQAVIRALGYSFPEEDAPGLMELCDEILEAAEAKLSLAQYALKFPDRVTTEEVESAGADMAVLKQAVSDAQAMRLKAEELRTILNHEITKVRGGKRSLLIIDEERTHATSQIHLVAKSFFEWYQAIEDQPETSEASYDPECVLSDGLSPQKAVTVYTTLGLLIELLAERGPPSYRNADIPNLSKIAEAVEKYARELNGGCPLSGQGKRNVTDCLNRALATLNFCIPPRK